MKTRSHPRSPRWPNTSTPTRTSRSTSGQVLFGETTSMTGDGPLGYYLSKLYKSKWFSSDTELEAGCGIMPIEYKNTSAIHAWQWAIGLEWYLSVEDPWRVVMSTDHPNGGSFLAYPQIIRLLMDGRYRQDMPQDAFRDGPRADAPSPISTASIRCRRSRSSPVPARADSGTEAQGPPRARRRRRHHDLYARMRTRRRCSQLPRYRHQGRPKSWSNMARFANETFWASSCTSPPRYDRDVGPDIEGWFERRILDPVAELPVRRRGIFATMK